MNQDYKKEISLNKKWFLRIFEEGSLYQKQGNYKDALAFYQMAANFAWQCHCGFYVSKDLEERLCELSNCLDSANDIGYVFKNEVNHVLHVITQALEIGGHTRLVWRWINNDRKRKHSVLLVNQGESKIPSLLGVAASSSGGEVCALPFQKDLMKRAESIMGYVNSSGCDLVALHIHPYDAPVVVALNRIPNIPVVYLNHADHVFWVGASISNQVACIREVSKKLCIERRGIPKGNCGILPIPLSLEAHFCEKEKTKKLYGFEGKTVLLSIASSCKYKPDGDNDFCKTLLPLIKNNINVVALIIGPSLSEKYWKEYYSKSEGRIIALGEKLCLDDYYCMSDIYLDSFPFASLTSFLDAAKRGIPVLVLKNTSSVLRANDKIVSQNPALSARGIGEWQKKLQILIDDEESRICLGRSVQKAIRDRHCQPGWNNYLETIYLDSCRFKRLKVRDEIDDKCSEDDIGLLKQGSSLSEAIVRSFFIVSRNLSTRAKLIFLPLILPALFERPLLTAKCLMPIKTKYMIKKWLGRS